MVEFLYHISIHLNVISLGIYISNSLFEQLEVTLELRRDHLDEFVIGFLFFLGLFGSHCI